MWHQFSVYHVDRLEAVGAAAGHSFDGRPNVLGLELSLSSHTYPWAPTTGGTLFDRCTLSKTVPAEELRKLAVMRFLLSELRRAKAHAIFVAGYELPTHFALAIFARLLGVRTIVMLDSKEDDKPRHWPLEWLKRVLLLPYQGGLAAGTRSAAYLRKLGFVRRPVEVGYDTISVSRMRAMAGDTPAPPFAERPFIIVARFVPKKNLPFALAAFAQYRSAKPASRRRLVICGDGPLMAEVKRLIAAHDLANWVDLLGFLDAAAVARHLRTALCLLIPSVEEQWGLVVNEALALDLPVIASPQVGACDSLIEDGGNGFTVPTDDPAAWARAMSALDDEARWQAMSARSVTIAARGDTAHFAQGTRALIDQIDARA